VHALKPTWALFGNRVPRRHYAGFDLLYALTIHLVIFKFLVRQRKPILPSHLFLLFSVRQPLDIFNPLLF
jgi:hypothetical protein